MKNIIDIIKDYLILYPYYYMFKSNRYFEFNGKKHKCFLGWYNKAWKNERTIEIPIILGLMEGYKKNQILEVGNVLSHYFPVQHDVVDKYEKAKGVINEDIVKFNPKTKYDLIISISTIEHVGWDEKPKEPQKVLKAIENLKKCLSSQGKIIITFPLGYNHFLDGLNKKSIGFKEIFYLKRISKDNRWIETTFNKVKQVKYNYPFHNGNGIAVMIITK